MVHFNRKKEARKFGTYAVKQYFCTRFRERNADELKYWNEVKVLNLHWKNFFKKFLLKSFGGSKKVLTFASAFEKKAIKKSSLKDLDINKQVVQKAYLGKQTETVNNLYNI